MIIILIIVLALISESFIFAVFFVFLGLNIIYAFIFLAHSMINIPQKMNIHSDINLSLEYYEYKANKKLTELSKFHDKIKTNYHRCQKTLKYIENIEYFLENNDIKIDSNSEENWDSFSEKSNENDFGDNNINQRNINMDEFNERNERLLKMGGFGLIGVYLFKIFFC